MDYFETLNSPKEAELAYAKWYADLPDERKAKMLADGFDFAFGNVKYNLEKQNPFIAEPAIKLRFIELNQKSEFPEDIFLFIQQKMAERSEQEWKQRFRKMKKHMGWTYDDMARFIGAESGNSLKASVSRKLPAFAKLAVCVFEGLVEGKGRVKK